MIRHDAPMSPRRSRTSGAGSAVGERHQREIYAGQRGLLMSSSVRSRGSPRGVHPVALATLDAMRLLGTTAALRYIPPRCACPVWVMSGKLLLADSN